MKAHVNLLATDLFEETRFPFQKVALPGAFLLLILAILAGTMVEFQRSKDLRQKIRDLNERQAAIAQSLGVLKSETDAILRQAQAASEAGEGKKRLLAQLAQERIPWSGLMQEVSFMIPENVWLSRLEGMPESPKEGASESGEKPIRELRFVGFASSHLAVTRWMSVLERSRHFENIQLVVAQKSQSAGQFRVDFEIKVSLKRG